MTERGKLPWMKFCPSDWRSDPGLRVCSLAARGLWMEMLALMHEAEPRGSLVMNGRPVTVKQLATLSGGSLTEVEALLSELRDAGVFSEEADGTIYSRRIRRDDAKAAEDKANGAKGGNPALNGGVNPPDKAKKLEARRQTPDHQRDADASLVTDKPVTAGNVIEIEPPERKRKREALRTVGEWWNRLAGDLGLPGIDAIAPGSERETHTWARARALEKDFGSLGEGLAAVESKIRGSPFLCGQKTDFRAKFNWTMNPTNMQKVLEGDYDEIRKAK